MKSASNFWKRLALSLLAVTCMVLAAVFFFGSFGFRDWQLRRLVAESEAALARGDYAQASISARRAVQIRPDHVLACEQMAMIYEKSRDPVALTWRQRIVELSPGEVDPLIRSAETALRFGQVSVARSELEKVPEADRQRADFHAASGAWAMASGDLTAAERGYAEAVRLAPENGSYLVSLGVAQSRSPDFFTKEEGRRLLRKQADQPEVARAAMRGLIASYEMTGEFSSALRVSRQLRALQESSFVDEITHLRLLRRTGDSGFGEALAALQTNAVKEAEVAAALATWMNEEGLAAKTVTWLNAAFPEVAKTPRVRAAAAVSLTGTGDWDALLELTATGPWQEAEFARQAFRSRALRERGQIPLANSAWKSAIVAATAETEALAWLARTAAEWNWPDENEAALFALVGKSGSREPLNALAGRYRTDGNTSGLRRLAGRLLEANPTDDNAGNDYALLSLLLETDVERAIRIAQEIHHRHPDEPEYTSTYAFALHYSGRSEEALRMIEQLPPTQLEQPAYAAYYGVILAANGASDKAQRYLQMARAAPLLSEERQLVEQALKAAGTGSIHAEVKP